jgi:Nucleotidyltransferase
VVESRSRLSKASVSTLNDESNPASALQFHLSLNDDIDDGIVSDADDSATEDDDQVFRTPVNANSAPPSPATIVAMETPSASPLQIEVHSVYKDLQQALDHLNKKLIATYAPESMRGGGLLVSTFRFHGILIERDHLLLEIL